MNLIIINSDEDCAIVSEELMEETEARVHHAEPLVVSGEICSEGPNGFPQPFLDGWAVDVVVVDPTFIAGIIGRIDEDAFDSAGVVGEECFEREEVIAFNEEVASTEGFVLNPEGSIAVVGECMYWHFIVMVNDSFFADPIERWHVCSFLASPQILVQTINIIHDPIKFLIFIPFACQQITLQKSEE